MFEQLWSDPIFRWALGIIIGFPLLVILLGELSSWLSRNENPFAKGVSLIRNQVVPTLAVLLLLREVLSFSEDGITLRMLQTLLWVVILYAILTLVSNSAQFGESTPGSSIANVPALLFGLARGIAVLLIVTQVTTGIWSIDLSNLVTAVGVGSLVIALALQDTLSNLVSGFLLIADRPFQVGDVLEVDNQMATVVDMNWRAVRLETFGNELLVIPNGRLGTQTIKNLTQPTPIQRVDIDISFAMTDPPNRVMDLLKESVASVENVRATPGPKILFRRYGLYGVDYTIRIYTHIDYWNSVITDINSRVYYMAKRNGLTIPLPVQSVHLEEGIDVDIDRNELIDVLSTNPLFSTLAATKIKWLAEEALVHEYGKGEPIIRHGEMDEYFYIIMGGLAKLEATDKMGDSHEVARLAYGDLFGEMTVLRDVPSPVSVTAVYDSKVIVLKNDTVTKVIATSPGLAFTINQFITERRKEIRRTVDTAQRTKMDHAENNLVSVNGSTVQDAPISDSTANSNNVNGTTMK
ncbi:MAG: mechanosensitive ion channel family protein [Chloroflexota bacterium]